MQKDIFRYWTISAGLSTAKAAALCGVTLRTYARYERGERQPPVAIQRLIQVQAMGMPLINGWEGWRFLRDGPDAGKLCAPDGTTAGAREILEIPYQRYIISTLLHELQRHRQYRLLF